MKIFNKFKANKPNGKEEDTVFWIKTEKKYINELVRAKSLARIWRSFALILTATILPICGLTAFFAYLYLQQTQDPIVLITSGLNRPEKLRASGISLKYIRWFMAMVVNKQTCWVHDDIEENYNFLFTHFYDHSMVAKTKQQLIAENRFNKAKKHKMVSMFKIIEDESDFGWCQALNMACGLVVGEETTYINNVQPYSKVKRGFLIFGKRTFQTALNPFVMVVSRLVVSDKPKEIAYLRKQLTASMIGKINQ